MAFHNTSERYEYIYGNNARKQDRFEELKKESGERAGAAPKKRREDVPVKNSAAAAVQSAGHAPAVDEKTAKTIRKNRARFLAFDWKYTVVALLAAAMCATGAFVYLHASVQLNVMENQIAELKTDKASLLSKQAALESEIDKSINLDDIRTYAEKKLHMVYPKDSKIILYQGESDDYFRQYESVNASK